MATTVRISTLFAIFLLIASASGASLSKRQVNDDVDDNDWSDVTEDTEEPWEGEEDVNGQETFGDDDSDTFAGDSTDYEETVTDEDNVDDTRNDEDFDEEETWVDEDNTEESWEDDVNDQETLDEEESWEQQADINGQKVWDDLDASERDGLEKELNLLSEEDDTDVSEDILRSIYETKVGNNDVQNYEAPLDAYKYNQRDQGRKASTNFWSDFKTKDKQWGDSDSEGM